MNTSNLIHRTLQIKIGVEIILLILSISLMIFHLFSPLILLLLVMSLVFSLGITIVLKQGLREKSREREDLEVGENLHEEKSSHSLLAPLPKPFTKEFQIITHGEYLDKIAKKSTQLYLLLQLSGVEIIRQDIESNRRFTLKGDEEWNGFEFIYILEGRLLYLERERVLEKGEIVITKGLSREYYFKTLSNVSLLYVTDASVFQTQCDLIENLLTLSKTVAEKDVTTESHCERLQELSMLIGEELRLHEDRLHHLIYGAYLHDIGKIRVPREILQKEGALSNEEWETIKMHPTWGRDIILEEMKGSYVEKVAAIVYQHHERYDGSGYPQRLKGDAILLEAQIVSIADTFDAITSDRPYKKKESVKRAIEEIERGAESQFHPMVVDAFLKVLEEYLANDKEGKDMV